jgi:hypothetical protein
MPAKKAHYRKPGSSSRFLSARSGREARGARHAVPVESIVVEEGVWDCMNKAEVQAVKKVVNLISEARENSGSKTPGVRLVVGIDRQRRIPKFEIEAVGHTEEGISDDLDAAISEARERGVNRAAQILAGREMLSAAEFAKFIGVSREAVRGKHQRHEVLGLHGAKRGLRFPKWQVTPNGKLLPDLPQLFQLLGGDSWTVYRFLIQHHPELEDDTALSALLRGKVDKVLAAAENTAGAFS